MTRKNKVGRNDACRCGSGRKFKYCCGKTESGTARGRLMLWAVAGVLAAAIAIGVSSAMRGEGGATSSGRIWSSEHGHWHDAP